MCRRGWRRRALVGRRRRWAQRGDSVSFRRAAAGRAWRDVSRRLVAAGRDPFVGAVARPCWSRLVRSCSGRRRLLLWRRVRHRAIVMSASSAPSWPPGTPPLRPRRACPRCARGRPCTSSGLRERQGPVRRRPTWPISTAAAPIRKLNSAASMSRPARNFSTPLGKKKKAGGNGGLSGSGFSSVATGGTPRQRGGGTPRQERGHGGLVGGEDGAL